MFFVDVFEEGFNGLVKLFWLIVIFCIQELLFSKLPQPLNDVEVGGVRRQEQQVNAQLLCCFYDGRTMLIAGVVQNDFDGFIPVLLFEVLKKLNQRISCNVVVLVRVTPFLVMACTAPSTLIRFLPLAARINSRATHHRQHTNGPRTK